MPHLVVALFALALACPWVLEETQEASQRFRRAVELQRSGALLEAEAEYRAVLASTPDYAEAHANLGAVLARLDRFDEAVAEYEAALRLAPALTPVVLNLGIAHYRRGDFERALAALESFLERSPGHLQATQLAGLALVELGRNREAVDYLQAAAAQPSADPAALYGLGLAYVRLRSPELGPVVERLAAAPGGAGFAHLLRGLASLDRSDFRQAALELERAAEVRRDLPRLHYSLGLARLGLGRRSEALVSFGEELRRNPRDFSTLYYIAYVQEQEGRLAEARARLEQALALEPGSAEGRALLEKIDARMAGHVAGRESRFVGSAQCASCHPAEARRQLASNMARAAYRSREHPLFERFKNQVARVGGLRFAFLWEGGPLRISISDGSREEQVPVQWALGAGVHGVTFFSELEKGEYLENLFSFYPEAGRLDFTPGQGERPFRSLTDAAGHRNDRAEAFRCLSCHTTGSRMDGASQRIALGELGVRCEACHGPGELHVEAVKGQDWQNARSRIENPRRYSARRAIGACGTCHREPPVDPTRVNWNDPENARFQPVGLSRSACFRQSGGALTCVTCHDPHSDARRQEPQFYARACAGCHAEGKRLPARHAAARGGDCVSCHMPKVEAMRHMEFRNHWIGVYSASSSLVPVRQP